MLRGDSKEPNRLILSPTDPYFSPQNLSQLIASLQHVGFMGSVWSADRYLIGEDFLLAIGFLGCAPSIQMEPLEDPNDLRFCHWHIPSATELPKLVASRTIKPPLCPECRHPFTDWNASHAPAASLTCPNCDKTALTNEWVWRRKGMCFSRFHITICNIFEGEAVPDAALLKLLEEATQTPWQYCYITP